MYQPVDNGDDAGCVREHLAPFGKRAVGGHDGRLELVTAVDDVEQQVGVAIAVGEIAHFIDDQHVRMRIVFQPTPQCVVTVLSGQVSKHLGGVDEQRAMPLHHGMVGDVLRIHRLADAVGPTRMMLTVSLIKLRVMANKLISII